MSKPKTATKAERIPTFQKSEMLPLWIAYNIDPKCGAPKEARTREDGVTYKGSVLCMGTAKQQVAKFVKLRKQLVLIYNADKNWTRRGWNNERLGIAFEPHRNPDVIMWPSDHSLTLSFRVLHDALWMKYPRFDYHKDEVSKIFELAKLSGFSMKKLKTPIKIDIKALEYTKDHLRYGRCKPTSEAKDIVRYYTPEAKVERARAAKEQAFQERINRQRYHVMQPFRVAHDFANSKLKQYSSTASMCTPEMLVTYLGHTPGRDDLYKRCHHDAGGRIKSKSNNFVWPTLVGGQAGAWAPDVDGTVVACRNGYHLTDLKHIFSWDNWGPHLWLAEGKGDVHAEPDKIAFRSARLVKYIGEITDDVMIKAYVKATGSDVQDAINQARMKRDIVWGELAMADAGYADCLAGKGTPEQEYIRFKIGENLDGQLLLGTEQGP